MKISREFIIRRIFSPGHIHTSRPSTGTTNAPKQRPFRVTDDSRKWTFSVFVQTFGQHNCDSVKAYEKGKSLIIASPQTSFGVRLSRIHFCGEARGKSYLQYSYKGIFGLKKASDGKKNIEQTFLQSLYTGKSLV